MIAVVLRWVVRRAHRHAWSPWVEDSDGAWRICVECLVLDER